MSWYSGHGTDVVGYAWNTEEWCPPCTFKAIIEAPLGYASYRQDRMEMEIAAYAERHELDIETTEVPHPIFRSDDALDNDGRARRCCRCHEPLVETDEESEEEA